MDRTQFHPDCFKSDPLHRAAASGSCVKVQQLLQSGEVNPYKPTPDGWTALHAAIANKAEGVVDLLLKRYEDDWAIVRNTIKHQFMWKAEQVGWKRRPILLARTEEECVDAWNLASTFPAGISLNVQVFVLLRHPYQGHDFVALDVGQRDRWYEVRRFIEQLLPNGVLSLDRSDMRKNAANYLQLACRLSTKEILVKLIKKGALLSVPSGDRGQTPFMVAVEKMRRDIVTLLLTEYSDQFDPLARDNSNFNALVPLMHRPQNLGMVKFLIEGLLHYRTAKLHEPKSVALGKIFQHEPELDKYVTFWSFTRPIPVTKLCESFINECGLDLSTRLSEITILGALVAHGIALPYCFEQINQNLDLLRLEHKYSKLNILHTLIRCKHLSFVKALYGKQEPLMKEIFEAEDEESNPAFELLRLLVYKADVEGLTFVLEHHWIFYMQDKEKLLTATVKQYNLSGATYEKCYEVLTRIIPELREDIDETMKESDKSSDDVFYDDLRALRDSFTKTVARLEANGKHLDDYLDRDRRTFLHAAAAWREKSLIEKLLPRGMDVMKLDNEGRLPIHLVDRFESLFEMILSKNESAQLSYVNPAGLNLLHIACKNGLRGSVLEKLLAHGFDVNGPSPDGQLPLSLASCCGSVTFLLEHAARIELLNADLLERSLKHMNYCAAMTLIPRMAHLPWFRQCAHIYLPWMIGNQNRDFFSCSNQSFLEEHPDIRRLLFDCLCANSKEQAAELFARVSHTAILCCVQWFLEYDYDIDYNHRFWGDSTPLIGLLSYMEMDVEGQLEAAQKLLLKPRVDVNAVDDRGRNALIALAMQRSWIKKYEPAVLSMAEALLERDVKVDAQDEHGNTALHYAFEAEHWELLDLLIEHDASVSVRNVSKKLACEMGSPLSRSLYGFFNPFTESLITKKKVKKVPPYYKKV